MPIESERPGKIKQMKKRYTEWVKIPIESGRVGQNKHEEKERDRTKSCQRTRNKSSRNK